MRSIFINYRRNDSPGEAGRLFDDLVLQFGPRSVFMDVAAIEPGRDFRKAIDQSIASCSVLLAMIGPDWLHSKDPLGPRRLDDVNDLVRIEVASALRRDIPVIPVLVRGARMPQPGQLPDDLKELAYRNAVELTHARWKSDVNLLIHALQPCMDPPTEASPATAGVHQVRQTDAPPAHDSASHPAMRGPAASLAAPAIEPQTLERISSRLATYIGPISEIVVKRAAKRCSSVHDLCETVAREIEAEADRAKFLRSCQS